MTSRSAAARRAAITSPQDKIQLRGPVLLGDRFEPEAVENDRPADAVDLDAVVPVIERRRDDNAGAIGAAALADAVDFGDTHPVAGTESGVGV
ncbi:hypothetical protein [Nocardia brevicatena]|uniref:hypothetical protein n=1 Tax=Nocardia brevicatena TaxID=37327 RepID=UPI000593589C|nr:hypothetical protein [Nocardia brevicatena]